MLGKLKDWGAAVGESRLVGALRRRPASHKARLKRGPGSKPSDAANQNMWGSDDWPIFGATSDADPEKQRIRRRP